VLKRVRRAPVLAIILASYTMIVLDISIVITALPKIHHTLDFSAAARSWVQSAYLLAFGGLLLLGPRARRPRWAPAHADRRAGAVHRAR
jgi:MFS family permease